MKSTSIFRKFLAVAMVFALAGGTVSPAFAATEDVGVRTSKIDSSDKVTKKEVSADTAPAQGASSITVNQTVHYLHSPFWFWKSKQAYRINYPGNADHVSRLGYWMYKDSDGELFRFNQGSKTGIPTPRPVVDVGSQAAPLSASDAGSVAAVTDGGLSGSVRSFNVITNYKHVETYNDVTYSVTSKVDGVFVPNQNAYMAWIGNRLYKVDSVGKVELLKDKPSAHIGVRASKIDSRDNSVSWDPVVTAGSVSFNGRSRELVVSRDYVHETSYEKQRYSLQYRSDAELVSEQSAYMAWIEQKLYKVQLGSNRVQQLYDKPVVKLGQRNFKIDALRDRLVAVEVIPTNLSPDNKSIVVQVRRHWSHEETFQVKHYYGQNLDIAHYNSTYKVWTVIVDGKIYAVAFDGDSVSSPDVIVIKAPKGMSRPDVIVVKPNDTDPPVVVPGKKKPPVEDEDPPVVVPGKKKPPVVIDNEDGPPVVIPGKR